MGELATADRLMEELGELLDPDAILAFAESKSWSVLPRDDAQIDITLDELDDSLVLAMPVGAVPSASASTVHEMLLRLGFLWRQTGGLHGTLNDEGEAVLLLRRRVDRLDAASLASLIGHFAAYAQEWARAVDQVAFSDQPALASNLPPLGGMRV